MKQLFDKIKNAISLSVEEERELNALIKKYPYFESLRVLHLKDSGISFCKLTENNFGTNTYISNWKRAYSFIYDNAYKPLKNNVIFTDNSNKNGIYSIEDNLPQEINLKKLSTEINGRIKEKNQPKKDIASETLANIYLKQELYTEAIETYNKLILNYPEKSIYFANRIEDIQKIIKNKE